MRWRLFCGQCGSRSYVAALAAWVCPNDASHTPIYVSGAPPETGDAP